MNTNWARLVQKSKSFLYVKIGLLSTQGHVFFFVKTI